MGFYSFLAKVALVIIFSAGLVFAAKGFQPTANVVKEPGEKMNLKINVGNFYRNVLKVRGDTEVIEACTEAEDFEACIDEQQSAGQKSRFERDIRSMNEAFDKAEEYGVYYRDIPFIRDFMGLDE